MSAPETEHNAITAVIVDAAIVVHRQLGPGLLESAYEEVLSYELRGRGLTVARQVPIPIAYKNLLIPDAFRADMILSGLVLVELKSVETVLPVHAKQVITYLRLSGLKVGVLLNFNSLLLKDGIRRIVNGLKE